MTSDIGGIAKRLRDRDLSPVELTQQCLERAYAIQPQFNAFVDIDADQAIAAARVAEAQIVAGRWRGPLHGIPVAVKDLYDLAGKPTTASSLAYRDRVASEDAQAVRRLRRAGAVIIGKTQTHECAYGTLTPQTRNPWDADRVAGGSSGGSAVAVAARCCPAALGTDTGGSVRIPAAACGVVGLKPTFGRIGRGGVMPLAWSLDTVGTITRTVLDAALLLEALAGHDGLDPASSHSPVPNYATQLATDIRGSRLGVPANYFFDHLDPEVEERVRTAIACFEDFGATLVEVTLPLTQCYLDTANAIIMAEAAEYHHSTLRLRGQDYGDQTRALLETGSLMPAVSYIRALRLREQIRRAWKTDVLPNIDALLSPAIPTPAVSAGETFVHWPDGRHEAAGHAYQRLNCPANLTGLPAVSVPCGFTNGGLPVGLEITGCSPDETKALQIASAFEAATAWHEHAPTL